MAFQGPGTCPAGQKRPAGRASLPILNDGVLSEFTLITCWKRPDIQPSKKIGEGLSGGEWLRSKQQVRHKKEERKKTKSKHRCTVVSPNDDRAYFLFAALLQEHARASEHTHTHTPRHLGEMRVPARWRAAISVVGMGIYSWLVLISQPMPCLI